MKYVQINTVPHGSTGTVMFREQEKRLAAGDECWTMWGRGRAAKNDHEFNFGSIIGVYLDAARTRLDDRAGFHSKAATRRLLAKLGEIDPDVIHLHNLHGYYINIEMLFRWLVQHRCSVKWTLHDCWPLTGHCSYFSYIDCHRWRSHCYSCPQKDRYPKSLFADASAKNYDDKKRVFNTLAPERMTLTVPSHWLAGIVRDSLLSKYPLIVEHHTVDKDTFRPRTSDFREQYGLQGKFLVLGVAYPFSERKGLSDFFELSKLLGNRFAVVLVGLSQAQIKNAPKEIVGIGRVDSKERLAEIYSAADVYLQPSVEETYGLTVSEAQACGTQVIVMRGSACEEVARLSDVAFYVSESSERTIAIIKELESKAHASSEMAERTGAGE